MPTWQVDISGTDLPSPSFFPWRETSRSRTLLRVGPVLENSLALARRVIQVRIPRTPGDFERLAFEATAERPVIALTTPQARRGAFMSSNNACELLPLDQVDPSRVGGLVLRLMARGEAWQRCREMEDEADALASKLLCRRTTAGPRPALTARLEELRLRHIMEVRGGPWRRVKPERHLGVSRSSLRTWIPSCIGIRSTSNRRIPQLRVAWRGGSPPPLEKNMLEFMPLEERQPLPISGLVDAVVVRARELEQVQALESELGRGPMPPIIVLTSHELASRFNPYLPLGLDVFVTSESTRVTAQDLARIISRLHDLLRLARLEIEIAEH